MRLKSACGDSNALFDQQSSRRVPTIRGAKRLCQFDESRVGHRINDLARWIKRQLATSLHVGLDEHKIEGSSGQIGSIDDLFFKSTDALQYPADAKVDFVLYVAGILLIFVEHMKGG